jgi:hypothetical protein
MELISVEKRAALTSACRNTLKLELRDNYAVDDEDLKAWRSGQYETLTASYQVWADEVASRMELGKTVRRVRIVSEPLSEYQQMSVRFSGFAVDAGEDLRWLPRRLTSTLLLPGNDFFVLDGEKVIFNVLDGADDRAEQQLYVDAETVKACRDAFEAAWSLAIPHHDFRTA